jgi:hypothetical protein
MAWPNDEQTEKQEAGAPAQSTRTETTARDAIGAQVQPAPAPRPQKDSAPAPQQRRASGRAASGGALDTLAQHYAALTPAAPAAAPSQGTPNAKKAVTPENGQYTHDRQGGRGALGAAARALEPAAPSMGRAPAHYQAGPTGHVGFAQTYGANAESARRAAADLLASVRGNARGLYDELDERYGAFKDDVARGAREATRSGVYEGPRNFEASDLADDFAGAADQMSALGRGAGGVQALRPRTSRFGAALTAAAARPGAEQLQELYGGIDSALTGAAAHGQDLVARREASALDAYQQGVAEQERLLQAERDADPYIRDAQGNIIGERGGPTAAQDGDADLL